MTRTSLIALCVLAVTAGPLRAHDGVKHETPAEAAEHRVATDGAKLVKPDTGGGQTPFPVDIGGPFRLLDQTGAERTQKDPEGRMQLLFFGYANCPAICSVALPLMASVRDLTMEKGVAVTPVMITVDPARDTVATMGPALAEIHLDFVGLTGDEPALSAARKAFRVKREHVFDDPEYGAIYSHGSHIYLLGADGEVLTLIPPILGADRAAEIVVSYATAAE